MARLQQKKQAAVTTGLAGHARPSPRDGWNGLYVVSLVHRACWPPCATARLRTLAAGHQHRGVRTARLRRAQRTVRRRDTKPRCDSLRPSHPTSHVS
ncbi:MAG: hypothetical protein EKK32_25870 [Bradyrhizobiaceae bacterium]|nr:MAG: hypothetical protein EKK32_25870 [Bradyrhizobiaceae bacterium]